MTTSRLSLGKEGPTSPPASSSQQQRIAHALPPLVGGASSSGGGGGVGTSSSSSSSSSALGSAPSTSAAATGAGAGTTPHAPGAAPLVTPHTLNLSLPYPPQSDPFVDPLPYQLLLAEMPAVLRAASRRALRRRRALLDEMEQAGFAAGAEAERGEGQGGHADEDEDENEDEEAELEARLEHVGALVGANLAERLSRDRPPLPTTLDVLKFLCKDFWIALWQKQVDGLRTNHRGVYVLQDHGFKPLLRVSSSAGSVAGTVKMQLPHAVGLLRGALARMGVNASVVAESAGAAAGGGGGGGATKDAGAVASSGTQGGLDLSHAAVTFHVRTAAAGPAVGAGGGGQK